MPLQSKRTSHNRKINQRETIPRILIVCEGERTEPDYFSAFRVTNAVIRGRGMNTLSLVHEAMRIRDLGGNFKQVWCVFDLDSFPEKNFDEAVRFAESEDIKVAYSNEAFELWYVLHFDYLQSASNREQYKDTLTRHLKKKYLKSNPDIYELLISRQSVAIANAKRLLNDLHPPHFTHAEKKPSTTVHELVIELNRLKSTQRS